MNHKMVKYNLKLNLRWSTSPQRLPLWINLPPLEGAILSKLYYINQEIDSKCINSIQG